MEENGVATGMEFNTQIGLALLSEKRKEWAAIEVQHAPLLAEIDALEKQIKASVKASGEEAEAAGLRVSFVAGRESFDGKMLYDVCGKVLRELESITDVAGVEKHPCVVASVKFLQYALEDGKKTGEQTIRIASVKEGKKRGSDI